MNNKYIIENVEFDADVVMAMFKNVFNYIGTSILNLNDDELVDIIYEDYNFHYTDLADFRLDILLDSGYISKVVKTKAQEMRKLSDKMFTDNVQRSAITIRNSIEWKRINVLADQIKSLLKSI